mmetsp:Transcript_159664/g.291353  ORF Transcript_159664/g.291353 Transcript_159664/m.291353 type:complete len:746 (-) Transcript_159664:111-2348(-)
MVEVTEVAEGPGPVSALRGCPAAKPDLQSKAAAAVTRRVPLVPLGDARVDLQSSVDVCMDWVPASPRRPLRSIVTPRCERQAVREQRRIEIERELREKLGMDELGGTAAAAVDGECAADNMAAAAAAAAAATKGTCAPTGTARRGGTPERPASRPSSARRVASGAAASSQGPPRPPKPKPHRPLQFSEDSPSTGSGSPSAEVLPQDRRWRSALLPIWPDRQTSQELRTESGFNSNCCADLSKTAPAAMLAENLPCEASVSSAGGTPSAGSSAALPSSSGGASAGRADVGGGHAESRCDSSRDRACAALSNRSVAASSRCDGSELKEPMPAAGPDSSARISAASVIATRCMEEEAMLAERRRHLEESAQRLRENAARTRLENRRWRVHDRGPLPVSEAGPPPMRMRSLEPVYDCTSEGTHGGHEEPAPPQPISPRPPRVSQTAEAARRFEEMRRKIAELDEINQLERSRLLNEQREMEERRRAQEEFERNLQERTYREMQEHREQEARAEEERALREEEERWERRARNRKRQEQLNQEQEYSRRLEVSRREGRSEAAQMKWQSFEEELDRQWAEQEAEERRRVDEYAKERRKAYEEWDRRLASERQRFASDAEFCEAARHRKARNAAHADEQFYGPRRSRNVGGAADGGWSRPPWQPHRPPPPNAGGNGGNTALPAGAVDLKNLSPEERAVLKELQSVRNASRDSQKAKVKELLFRWHPDKNPTCVEKATQVFQFVQRQREVILGL